MTKNVYLVTNNAHKYVLGLISAGNESDAVTTGLSDLWYRLRVLNASFTEIEAYRDSFSAELVDVSATITKIASAMVAWDRDAPATEVLDRNGRHWSESSMMNCHKDAQVNYALAHCIIESHATDIRVAYSTMMFA